jgi:hypothetical protein
MNSETVLKALEELKDRLGDDLAPDIEELDDIIEAERPEAWIRYTAVVTSGPTQVEINTVDEEHLAELVHRVKEYLNG